MTKRLAMAWGMGFLLAACAAPAREGAGAGEAPAPAAAKAQAKAKGQPKVVCEEEETVGTHFTRRVCHRVDESDLQRDLTQDALRSNYSTNARKGG